MYEIWLMLNIGYEVAMSIWPVLVVALTVWLAMLWIAGHRLSARTLTGSVLLGVVGALVAGFVLPSLSGSSFDDMSYWLDWATLVGLAVACGAVVTAFAFPLLSLMRRVS